MPRQAITDLVDLSVDVAADLTSSIDDLRVADGTRVWNRGAGPQHGLWCLDQTSALPPSPTVLPTLSGTGRWIFFGAGAVPPASGAPIEFIYRPAEPAPAGNVYASWPALVAAATPVHGQKVVYFDDTLAPCAIPVGAWNFGDGSTAFIGRGGPLTGLASTPLAISDGATLLGVYDFAWLDIDSQSTSAAAIDAPAGQQTLYGFDYVVRVRQTGVGGLFIRANAGAGTAALAALRGAASFVNAGGRVIGATAAGALVGIGTLEASSVGPDTVESVVGSTVIPLLIEPASTLDPNQPNVLSGPFVPQLVSVAAKVNYDDLIVPPPLGAGNVQDAIDKLKGFVGPLLFNVYVAKNGNDATADGSYGKPFLTVQAAMDYAWTTYVVPIGPQPAPPFTRPCVFVCAGTYDDGPLVLPPQICVMGEGYNHTRIQGNWTIDTRWSNYVPPSLPSPPSVLVPNDFRSSWINVELFGDVTVDFDAAFSNEGKLYAVNTRFAGNVTISEKLPNPVSNSLLFIGCDFRANVDLTGIPALFVGCVSGGGGTLTLHQAVGTGVDNTFETSGGSFGNIVVDSQNPLAPPYVCMFTHGVQTGGTLTLLGPFSAINADVSSLPLQTLVSLIAGANINQIARLNQPNFSGTTVDRPPAPYVGQQYFDTDLRLPIWWDGTSWIALTPQNLALAGTLIGGAAPVSGFLSNSAFTSLGAVAPGYVRNIASRRLQVSWNFTVNTFLPANALTLVVRKNGAPIPGWPLFIIPGGTLGVTLNFGGGFTFPVAPGDVFDASLSAAAPGVGQSAQLSVSLDFIP